MKTYSNFLWLTPSLSFSSLCILSTCILSLVACSNAKQALVKKPAFASLNYTVDGWVATDFIESADTTTTDPTYAQVLHDVYVESLLKQGLNREISGWLTSKNGEKNLLWTLDPKPGNHNQSLLIKHKEMLQSPTFQYRDGTINLANRTWRYIGYIDEANGRGAAAFQSFIFTCKGAYEGASAFYWGNGIRVEAYQNNDIKSLLTQLSEKCN